MAHGPLNWQPLAALSELFHFNVEALATRDLPLATSIANHQPGIEWFVAAERERVHLGRRAEGAGSIEPLPNPVPPRAAAEITARLFPSGKCTESVLVAGLDQGWLWQQLFRLEVHTPTLPGHTPPLYFLAPNVDRLWIVLHLHDWTPLLSHPRTLLFAGPDAVGQAQRSMADRPAVPIPRLSVTVDPATWPGGASIDSVTQFAVASAAQRMEQAKGQFRRSHRESSLNLKRLAAMYQSGRKLRVLGITSRYTTFLQYSMRDWLAGFDALGHETRILIEADDASQHNPIVFAEACATFQPDLILMLDHYRAEFSGLPADVPWVMWVQDELFNIFRATAGAAQQRLDYTIGFGRLDCVYKHGYPSDRFMPAPLATNENRFVPRRLTHAEREKHTCDVSFVSHSSTVAEVLAQQEAGRQSSPDVRRLIGLAHQRLSERYAAGESVATGPALRRIADDCLRETRLEMDDPAPLLSIVTQKLNNALFRHQALGWVADVCDREGLRLHLYGRGWESHPRFGRYARGVADNQTDLSAICQASKINLQISPFGSAHQRVYDGLCAGGFFLLRSVPGDRVDELCQSLAAWCAQHGVTDDARLTAAMARPAGAEARALFDELTAVLQQSPMGHGYDFVSELRVTAQTGFNRNGSTIWPEQFPFVAFSTREELLDRIRTFVHDSAAREQLSRGMRARVADGLTYRAIAGRTIEFVARDLALAAAQPGLPAAIAA